MIFMYRPCGTLTTDFFRHREIQVAGKSTMEDEPEQEDKETSPVSQYPFFIVFIQTFLFTLFITLC